MKILYILRHNPWGIGGGCYACRNYLEAFSTVFKDASFDILLCDEYYQTTINNSLRKSNFNYIGVKARSSIDRLLFPLTKIMHRYQNKAKEMLRNNKYDYCIFDDNCIAGSLVHDFKNKGVKTIVINHNCELEYYRDNLKGIKRTLVLPVVKSNESMSYKNCDFNIFLTSEDVALFKALYGHTDATNLVVGCFMQKEEVLPICGDKDLDVHHPTFVISGTIGNIQNLDGIYYFLDYLYDLLPKDSSVIITGKNPPASLMKRLAGYNNIVVKPNPDDILSIVKQSDVFLCPTRSGGGMKLRVMDGLRCGVPVLAQDISARGYSQFVEKGCLFHYKDKDDFKKQLDQLLSNIGDNKLTRMKIQEDTLAVLDYKKAVSLLQTIKQNYD